MLHVCLDIRLTKDQGQSYNSNGYSPQRLEKVKNVACPQLFQEWQSFTSLKILNIFPVSCYKDSIQCKNTIWRSSASVFTMLLISSKRKKDIVINGVSPDILMFRRTKKAHPFSDILKIPCGYIIHAPLCMNGIACRAHLDPTTWLAALDPMGTSVTKFSLAGTKKAPLSKHSCFFCNPRYSAKIPENLSSESKWRNNWTRNDTLHKSDVFLKGENWKDRKYAVHSRLMGHRAAEIGLHRWQRSFAIYKRSQTDDLKRVPERPEYRKVPEGKWATQHVLLEITKVINVCWKRREPKNQRQ